MVINMGFAYLHDRDIITICFKQVKLVYKV